MKKAIFLMLTVLLTGCLGTNKQLLNTEASPATWANIAPVTSRLWWRKNTAGMTKAQNPWEKFNQPKPRAKWHNPWTATDLQELGVTKFKPTKPIQYRIINNPNPRVLIVPENEFEKFYERFFKKKKAKKHPLQDKLFPPKKKKKKKRRKGKAY